MFTQSELGLLLPGVSRLFLKEKYFYIGQSTLSKIALLRMKTYFCLCAFSRLFCTWILLLLFGFKTLTR